jgi:uncharacterized protein YndB with AHSA1/START domain
MTRWKLTWDGAVEADVDASPEEVWNALADVTRVGEWSHECRTATWLAGAHEAKVGAEFTGRNRSGLTRWSRRCTITEADPGRSLAYRTSGGVPPDSTQWRFDLEALPGGGTRIHQSFRILALPRPTEMMIYLLVPQHRDRREALRGDLARLGEVASGRVPSISS